MTSPKIKSKSFVVNKCSLNESPNQLKAQPAALTNLQLEEQLTEIRQVTKNIRSDPICDIPILCLSKHHSGHECCHLHCGPESVIILGVLSTIDVLTPCSELLG